MPPSKKKSNMHPKDRIFSKFTNGRTKSMKKRKKSLLREYKLMNKSNKFIDRRIGEKDRNMTSEDRVMSRLVVQRVKSQNKKQMFNLNNDEEVLTHQGRTLQDIEKFDNPRSDSEDEDGKLKASFVENAHFGGGLFSRNTNNESTRQNNIDQLVAESKRLKAERQQTKEETQTLTDKLDKDLKELFPVFNNCKADEPLEAVKMKQIRESYDILVRELKFEPVGKPSNKIKLDEEIAAEEKEKLEILERERLERMKRKQEVTVEDESNPASKKHISADELDNDFDLDESDSDNDSEEHEESGDEYSGQEKENGDSKNVTHGGIENKKKSKPPIVPVTFTDLVQELEGKNSQEKITHIEDLMKIQKIHTGVSMKGNFIKFFEVLLDYVDSLFTQIIVCEDSYALASQLSPVLFDLLKIGEDEAAKIVFSMLKKKQQRFVKAKKFDLTLDTLIFLKFIPLLFPTSDYHHPIATPAMAFVCHILWKNACKTIESIAKGLFLCTVVLEFVHFSGRYCPEAIIFLRNVVYTAIPDFEDPHPPVHIKNKILVLNIEKLQMNESSESQLRLKYSSITPDSNTGDDDMVKLNLIYSTLRILISYSNIYSTFSACQAIWSPVASLLSRLKCCHYPEIVKSEIVKLEDKIKSICERPVQFLMAEKKRPKALRLYEPNIRPVINGRSFRTVSQDKLEKEKLLYQYKREMKGALREIRKDKNFLARVKLTELAKKDMERREKVKRIFGWGQTQQNELKQMERKNRYRRTLLVGYLMKIKEK